MSSSWGPRSSPVSGIFPSPLLTPDLGHAWCRDLGICSMKGFPGDSGSKVSACSAGDLDSIPGSGRCPGGGNGNPLQYSCLENPMDGGAWEATVHGVAKSRTWLSNFTLTFSLSVEEDLGDKWQSLTPQPSVLSTLSLLCFLNFSS